jgi:hypothetical protein
MMRRDQAGHRFRGGQITGAERPADKRFCGNVIHQRQYKKVQ